MLRPIYFVSGHLDLTPAEFAEHYIPILNEVLFEDPDTDFVVGDARGADSLAQIFLAGAGVQVLVFHMFEAPRFNAGFPTRGGFTSDEQRDRTMTEQSTGDIAWVRPGRESSGTAKNLRRRDPGVCTCVRLIAAARGNRPSVHAPGCPQVGVDR